MHKKKVLILSVFSIIVVVSVMVFTESGLKNSKNNFKNTSDTFITKESKYYDEKTTENDELKKDEENCNKKISYNNNLKKDDPSLKKSLIKQVQATVSDYVVKGNVDEKHIKKAYSKKVYAKKEDNKKEDLKKENLKKEDNKKEGLKNQNAKKEDNKKEDLKKENVKKEDNKKEDLKKENVKKEDNKEDLKKENVKKEDNKKEDLKKENTKKEDNSQSSSKDKVSKITFVKLYKTKYKSHETLKGILFGNDLTDKNVTIKLLKNNKEIKTNINITNCTGKKFNFSIELPENNTFNNEEYILVFENKDNTSFKRIKIEIQPSENNTKMYVEGLEVLIDKVSSKGGVNPVTVNGYNLDSEKIELKLFKNNILVESKIKLIDKDKNVIKYMIDISENKTNKYIDYRVELKYDNKVISKNFKQAPIKIENDKLGTKVKHVIIDETLKKITIEFDQEIDVLRDDIKEYIGISKSLKTGSKGELLDNFEILSKEDNIYIYGKKVVINLNKPFDNLLNKRIKIREGAFETKDGKYSCEFEGFIYKDTISHYESLTLDKDILDSKGGIVVAKLKGSNLIEFKEIKEEKVGKIIKVGTVAKIKKSTENKSSDEINCEVKGEGEEQTITFKLPENKTNRTQSYVLRISLDGGYTFIDQRVYTSDRSDVAVISVLPQGVSKNEKTLSNMIIWSYGATEDGDLTKTSCSINQESKKTQVGLYGTNLEKWTTKFKLVDEKGIEWPILTNPGHDSSDFPTMVLDWNGIIGEGNYERIEIILPNNIDNEPEFTYYVAVDGKNFDKNVKVKANVPTGLDGLPNRFRDKIVELTIRGVDEDGKEIYTKSKKGYYWFIYQLLTKEQLNSKIGGTLGEKLGHELEIPEIEGYEYDPKATNKEELEGTYGESGKVVTLVYKNKNKVEKPKENNLADITFVKLDEKEYKSKEILKGSLFGSNLTDKNVAIKLLKNNKEIKTNINITNSTDKKFDFSIELPENNTFNNEEYTLIFQNKDNTSSKKMQIKVLPIVKIENIGFTTEKLNKDSKQIIANIIGSDIENKKVSIKLLKDSILTDVKGILIKDPEYRIIFPIKKNDSDKEIKYTIRISNGYDIIEKDIIQLTK